MQDISGNDPVKIEAFCRMPLVEYYAILNNALAEQNKQLSNMHKRGHNGSERHH